MLEQKILPKYSVRMWVLTTTRELKFEKKKKKKKGQYGSKWTKDNKLLVWKFWKFEAVLAKMHINTATDNANKSYIIYNYQYYHDYFYWHWYYHLVDMNISILLVESPSIKPYHGVQVHKHPQCAFKTHNTQGAVRMIRLALLHIKVARTNLSSMGSMVSYYLFVSIVILNCLELWMS